MTTLLEVEALGVERPGRGRAAAGRCATSRFEVKKGEAVAVVGESGSGKSMTARAIGRLLPAGARASGEVSFHGESVLEMSGACAARRTAQAASAMIFQDPRASINPVLSVGDFLTEPLDEHAGDEPPDGTPARRGLLDDVGVSRPEERLRQYPHELSGGLLQRVMIAAVLAMEPSLILADEPTTALDVTTQSDVMSILDEARRERGMGLLLITHDLELAAAVCDRTLVMYGGRIMEEQASWRLHDAPLHPYTAALLASRPSLTLQPEYLEVIPGRPLSAVEAPGGLPVREPLRAGDTGVQRVRAGRAQAPRRAHELYPRGDARAVARQRAGGVVTEAVLEVIDLQKTFAPRHGLRRGVGVTALAGVSFELRKRRALGVVGESGSGKTTIARIIVGLEQADGRAASDRRRRSARAGPRRGRAQAAGAARADGVPGSVLLVRSSRSPSRSRSARC